MKAGKYHHRVIIEKPEQTQDQTTGHIAETWIELGKFWSEFMPLSTKDQLQAQAVQSTMVARCEIRYSSIASQINSAMRLKFRGSYYKIDGDPVPDNRSGLEWLTLNLSSGDKGW